MSENAYTKGDYLKKNPTWDAEDSPWKARQIIRMIKKNDINPRSICEVGCGAGEILKQLQLKMDKECVFRGYEISPQALELCKKKANERLNFELKDILKEENAFFDLILLIDVIEHLEDYPDFLRKIKPKSRYKIFHIPLDLSVQTVLRDKRLLRDRESVGHIHYFTKSIALQVLKDAGYELVDFFYTPSHIELRPRSLLSRIARFPRKLFFAIHKDLTVRLAGGFSLMVLAR